MFQAGPNRLGSAFHESVRDDPSLQRLAHHGPSVSEAAIGQDIGSGGAGWGDEHESIPGMTPDDLLANVDANLP